MVPETPAQARMTGADLQAAVVECARLLGWRVFHARPARSAKGWRTPVAYDGKGYPDLTLARRGRVVFIEVKGDRDRLRPEQSEWLAALTPEVFHSTHDALVIGPDDWVSGRVEELLR